MCLKMTPEQKAGKVDKGEKLDWIGKLNSFKEEKEQEDDDEEDERERERESTSNISFLLDKKFSLILYLSPFQNMSY